MSLDNGLRESKAGIQQEFEGLIRLEQIKLYQEAQEQEAESPVPEVDLLPVPSIHEKTDTLFRNVEEANWQASLAYDVVCPLAWKFFLSFEAPAVPGSIPIIWKPG
ncbi:hypothetical protein DAPPUDRAFT_233582 [Daphnia pulex]|uniref:Uncharacterized protein n=1 Tax=Daphnia pulex TaxID=6669 RepID=E9FV68_DAPPU|nr:hypothetical protein DAPPUDRAFT_233582 [Daphnia pulex]|eukprot:EFX88504.1 hypothetical protein DAPPUDRAFT_233582 [Daphnia pulex]